MACAGQQVVGVRASLRSPCAPKAPEGRFAPQTLSLNRKLALTPQGAFSQQLVGGGVQHNPQYANYWASLTRKRHIPSHPAQPRHTNDWAPRTRKRHQQEHRPQRPTERSDPTQHAKGSTGDRPGPRKETTTRRNVTQGVRVQIQAVAPPPPPPSPDCVGNHRRPTVPGGPNTA